MVPISRGKERHMGEEQEPSAGRPPPSRIVVADDDPIYRFALREILKQHGDLEVVGEASDGHQAIGLCRRLRPDLVIMDLRMPGMSGIEATRKLKEHSPSTLVLVLSGLEDPDHLSEALKAGAAGYLLKGASASQIVEATRKVLLGESLLNQEVATRLLMRLVEEARRKDAPPLEEMLPEVLSPREVEVLHLMAGGKTNHQIARELFVSVSTVKKHVHSVLTKLGASDRTQAIVKAVEPGWDPTDKSHNGKSPP
jgi:DNA-binding NarL/FixJ family response regulator